MEFKLYDFRDALAVLRDRPDWDELVSEIRGITRSEVLKVQAEYRASGKRVPAGAQKAVNEVFRRRLVRSDQHLLSQRLFIQRTPTVQDGVLRPLPGVRGKDQSVGYRYRDLRRLQHCPHRERHGTAQTQRRQLRLFTH